jgi:hypothetical protein
MVTAEVYNALLRGEVLEDVLGGLWRLSRGLLVNWDSNTCMWIDCDHIGLGLPASSELKIKVKTININGFDVIEPLQVEPKMNDIVYVTAFNLVRYREIRWIGADIDMFQFANGLVHASPANAIAHANALLSFTMLDKM